MESRGNQQVPVSWGMRVGKERRGKMETRKDMNIEQ
jgi:hypothetical protein